MESKIHITTEYKVQLGANCVKLVHARVYRGDLYTYCAMGQVDSSAKHSVGIVLGAFVAL